MDLALDILRLAKEKNVQLHLPVDVLAADDFSNTANTQIVDITAIPSDWQGLDCGPKSKAIFHDVVQQCKTILWNGPLGFFEREEFSKGTLHLAKVISESDAYSVIGGGETLTAFNQSNLLDKVGYASTAGGAFLEYIEKGSLPSLDALKEKI